MFVIGVLCWASDCAKKGWRRRWRATRARWCGGRRRGRPRRDNKRGLFSCLVGFLKFLYRFVVLFAKYPKSSAEKCVGVASAEKCVEVKSSAEKCVEVASAEKCVE